MEKQTRSLPHLLITALFVGILLSFSLFYLIHSASDRENAVADTCLDGTRITGEDLPARFERAVYQNADTLSRIREHQFLLFRAISDQNVIVGKENFLFEIADSEYSYNYLEDYLGNVTFSDEEHAAILSLLQKRAASYEQRGAKYLLVVIPNAQTVYSENMPAYLGVPKKTRLSRLGEYLTQNGFNGFLDLSEDLLAQKSDQPLYNNTENSLNSLGVYHAYRAVCKHFEGGITGAVSPTIYEDLSFYQHHTTGKAIARRAGVADVVPNLTVSLSNNTPKYYLTVHQTGRVTQTTLREGDLPLGMTETPSVLLQFTNQWERLQAEPFFSNTFKRVTYQTNWTDDPDTFALAQPSLVVQYVYENQLSWLLPRDFVSRKELFTYGTLA